MDILHPGRLHVPSIDADSWLTLVVAFIRYLSHLTSAQMETERVCAPQDCCRKLETK
jgi:hypothetical protein